MIPISTEDKLQERIKELTCLYDISSALLLSGSVEDAFYNVTVILKQAWRYHNDAIAEIKLDETHVFSNVIPFESVFQEEQLLVFGEVRGYVRVHYGGNHDQNHFLDDEQLLLKKVAAELSFFYERKITDNKIEVLQKKAEQAHRLSVLGEITAGIAHELNTPLGNILGFAELLSENAPDSKSREDAAKVVKSAVYAREIVKKLMFFACDMPQNFTKVKVKPIIDQALALVEPNFRKSNLEFSFTCHDPDLEATVDSLQLTQVMFNLLVNAIQFSPSGSAIAIAMFATPDSLVIDVADQGPGIDPEIRQNIFDPFFTTRPLGEGSGLGLSVVHGIVRSHKGEISTYPNVPRGTVFRVQLPLKQ